MVDSKENAKYSEFKTVVVKSNTKIMRYLFPTAERLSEGICFDLHGPSGL